MTNKKPSATSGKVKVPGWGVMFKHSNSFFGCYYTRDDARSMQVWALSPTRIVRLSGTVTYTLAK